MASGLRRLMHYCSGPPMHFVSGVDIGARCRGGSKRNPSW